MAEEENTATDAIETVAVTGAEATSTTPGQEGAGRKKSARVSRPKGSAPKASPKPASTRSKKYSDDDKLELLRQIDAQLAAGGTTLKDAVKSAGISDQTYYQWKKASKPDDAAMAPSVSEDDEFAEFIQLEQENRRLRNLLAEKLRAENADLRRRLGLN